MRIQNGRRGGRPGHGVLLGLLAGLLVSSVALANDVFVDGTGNCGGHSPCYTTIQMGVNHAVAPANVFVFPGSYPESVNLSMMSTPGNITIVAGTGLDVDKIHPGSVTVNPAMGAAFYNSVSPFPGDVQIIGFIVMSGDSDGINLAVDSMHEVFLAGVTADENALSGLKIVSGSMLLFDSSASGNKAGFGLDAATSGDTSLFNLRANHNKLTGIFVSAGGEIQVFGFPFSLIFGRQLFAASADYNGGNGMELKGADDVNVASLALTSVVPANLAARLPNPNLPQMMAHSGLKNLPVISGAMTQVTDSGAFQPVTADGNEAVGVDISSTGGSGSFALARANGNGNIGVNMDVLASATAAFASANSNKGSGFHLVSETDDVEMFLITALRNYGDGVTVYAAGQLSLVTSFIRGNSLDGVNIAAVGPDVADDTSQVTGNIICNNSVAGLRLDSYITLNAIGNWWGAADGPLPTGSGNAIQDGHSGGGAGTVNFIPFIDTVTASFVDTAAVVGFALPVRFQFSGGDKSVFLGAFPLVPGFTVGPGDPFGVPPFTVSTDNGVVIFKFEPLGASFLPTQTGPTLGTFINRPEGITEVGLFAGRSGAAKITLTGPCGLDGSITIPVRGTPAPALSTGGMLLLAVLLACGGFWIVRRRFERGTADA